MNNLYEILGLDEKASFEEIKRAYFKLIRKYSPEKDPERFKQIREAYEILSDEATRQQYNLIVYNEKVKDYFEEINLLIDNGEYITALSKLKLMKENNQYLFEVYAAMANCYYNMGEIDKAKNILMSGINESSCKIDSIQKTELALILLIICYAKKQYDLKKDEEFAKSFIINSFVSEKRNYIITRILKLMNDNYQYGNIEQYCKLVIFLYELTNDQELEAQYHEAKDYLGVCEEIDTIINKKEVVVTELFNIIAFLHIDKYKVSEEEQEKIRELLLSELNILLNENPQILRHSIYVLRNRYPRIFKAFKEILENIDKEVNEILNKKDRITSNSSSSNNKKTNNEVVVKKDNPKSNFSPNKSNNTDFIGLIIFFIICVAAGGPIGLIFFFAMIYFANKDKQK